MKNKKRELTTGKVVGAIIAGILIIAIQVYEIYQIKPDHIEDVWKELLLLIVGLGLTIYIVISYYFKKKG